MHGCGATVAGHDQVSGYLSSSDQTIYESHASAFN